MLENKYSSISQADTDVKIGEFWDDHDFTDFDTNIPDIQFEIACNVTLEPSLFNIIEKYAEQKGITVETLVNLWLQQKITEQLVV